MPGQPPDPREGQYAGNGHTREEALENAYQTAKKDHGPGWYKIVATYVEFTNPISEYRVDIEPVP